MSVCLFVTELKQLRQQSTEEAVILALNETHYTNEQFQERSPSSTSLFHPASPSPTPLCQLQL